MEYTILIHKAEEGGYWTEVPSLSGCFSQGETVEEAIENTKDAIQCHIEALREDGQEIVAEEKLLIAHVKVAA